MSVHRADPHLPSNHFKDYMSENSLYTVAIFLVMPWSPTIIFFSVTVVLLCYISYSRGVKLQSSRPSFLLVF